jgi:hypothetical protein
MLPFIGFNPVPIANEPPFVMEPYANREKLRIEHDGGVVRINCLIEPAETFKRRAHVGVRFGEIRAQ